MRKAQQYIAHVQHLIQRVMDSQMDNIEAAGTVVADTVRRDGLVYTFGTGHSHMMAEELFYRAGGLANIYPIFEEALMLHKEAVKSTEMERQPGYAQQILARYPCTSKDCLILASNSGRNVVNIEMVNAAHKIGMKVIALTNLAHSQAQPSRHASGKKVYELADVVLDNQGCIGDACLPIPEINRTLAATSTSLGALLLQAVIVSAAEQMVAQGHVPDVFVSSNLDEGDAINHRILTRYRPIVKPL